MIVVVLEQLILSSLSPNFLDYPKTHMTGKKIMQPMQRSTSKCSANDMENDETYKQVS